MRRSTDLFDSRSIGLLGSPKTGLVASYSTGRAASSVDSRSFDRSDGLAASSVDSRCFDRSNDWAASSGDSRGFDRSDGWAASLGNSRGFDRSASRVGKLGLPTASDRANTLRFREAAKTLAAFTEKPPPSTALFRKSTAARARRIARMIGSGVQSSPKTSFPRTRSRTRSKCGSGRIRRSLVHWGPSPPRPLYPPNLPIATEHRWTPDFC